jgi:PE family
MSFVNAVPEEVSTAAGALAGIGSALAAANAAAATPTTRVLAPAQDGVSAAVTAVFDSHGQLYQSLSSQLAEFHANIVQTLRAGAGSYAAAESANASIIQELLGAAGTSS